MARIIHRRSIRLAGYDYGQTGAYIVTICAHDRACLFGDVVDGVVRLNRIGEIVRDDWSRTPIIRITFVDEPIPAAFSAAARPP